MSSRTFTPLPRLHEREGQTATVEALTRRAHYNLEKVGVTASPSKVSRLIRSYLKKMRSTSVPDFDAYFMPHIDPTGETAVSNAMSRGR